MEQSRITWDENGQPRSTLFDDKYFCAQDGLAESLHVFCGGNALKERWAKFLSPGPVQFTLVEMGFGSGLNFLCAWRLWREWAPPDGTLHYISVDRYPLSVEELTKVLALWPVLNNEARLLAEHYAPNGGPIQDIVLDQGRVKLTLIFDHALNALDALKEQKIAARPVDAWFLDGFAPSKNPDMWSEDIFARMAALSHSCTTLSTFTAAGSVRRGLSSQGFSVSRMPGFGRKRHMLQGVFTGGSSDGVLA
jgi:tRNA 5-methylaminomethyl-2-thiouridine biosynthesis bifunctional protein